MVLFVVVCCFLIGACCYHCLMFDVCCMRVVGAHLCYSLLPIVGGGAWLLRGGWCVLFDVCCLLPVVVYCLLFEV